MQIEGENAFGLLAGESGVHRLVRISPFDQAARRHTSFASVFVIPEIDDRIEIVVKPEDLRIDTFRAGATAARTSTKSSPQCVSRISQRHRRAVPERTQPAQKPRNRHEGPALAPVRAGTRKAPAKIAKLDATKSEISFGSQIRSYVMQPYQLIKDHRTKVERGDVRQSAQRRHRPLHPRLPALPAR